MPTGEILLEKNPPGIWSTKNLPTFVVAQAQHELLEAKGNEPKTTWHTSCRAETFLFRSRLRDKVQLPSCWAQNSLKRTSLPSSSTAWWISTSRLHLLPRAALLVCFATLLRFNARACHTDFKGLTAWMIKWLIQDSDTGVRLLMLNGCICISFFQKITQAKWWMFDLWMNLSRWFYDILWRSKTNAPLLFNIVRPQVHSKKWPHSPPPLRQGARQCCPNGIV